MKAPFRKADDLDRLLQGGSNQFNGLNSLNMNRAQQTGESEAECLDRLATEITTLRRERASIALILELAERLNGPMR